LRGHQEKVLGVKEAWAAKHPETHIAMVKALIKACEYCDDRRNREEIVNILSQPQYVGVDSAIIRPGFLDGYDRGLGTAPEALFRFNQFYVDQANCPGRKCRPYRPTQLARWGYAPFPATGWK
jgi:nitrate/nitrite transport system ATP-binding protein